MAGGTALEPFDRHPADAGALYGGADALADQASRAIDASRLSFYAFTPAIQNWDGIASPELRAAPRPVREKAFEVSDSLSWAAAAVRYWAGQVTDFNTAVDEIRSQLLIAQTQIFGATDSNGKPVPLSTMLEAVQAVENEAKRMWREAYHTHIVAGAATAAGMLRDGPTPGNVAAAGAVGVLPPGRPWNPLSQMWDSFKNNVLPPDGYGPLGPWPWVGGRVAFGVGAGATAAGYRYGYPHADGKPWKVFGRPNLHPQGRSLVDRAARAAKVGGTAATFLGSLSERLRNGGNVPKAAVGAAAETATVGACARGGAAVGGAVADLPGAVGGGIIGGAACSPVGRWIGDRAADAGEGIVDSITDGFKSLAQPHF
jgi:hypothetical protein